MAPTNDGIKTTIRAYQQEHGLSYNEAARQLGLRSGGSKSRFTGLSLGPDFPGFAGLGTGPRVPIDQDADARNDAQLILLRGALGSGKSHIARAMVKDALRSGVEVIYHEDVPVDTPYYWGQLADLLPAGENRDSLTYIGRSARGSDDIAAMKEALQSRKDPQRWRLIVLDGFSSLMSDINALYLTEHERDTVQLLHGIMRGARSMGRTVVVFTQSTSSYPTPAELSADELPYHFRATVETRFESAPDRSRYRFGATITDARTEASSTHPGVWRQRKTVDAR